MSEQALAGVSFRVATTAADALEDLLCRHDIPVSSWHHAEAPEVEFTAYCESTAEAEALRDRIGPLLSTAGLPAVTLSITDLGTVDWQEAWKQFFHPEHISPHILIHPSWEPVTAPPGVHRIEIDPGMSFGTGLHGTTRACIQLLDRLHDQGVGGALLDAGCGSGILAIAALRLGFAPVEAFDIDPQAVHDTTTNLARNGLTARVETGDVNALPAGPAVRVMVANILAPVLLGCAPSLLSRLRPDGNLILSGILDRQFPDVQACYEAHGLQLRHTVRLGEWTSGCFSAATTAAAPTACH